MHVLKILLACQRYRHVGISFSLPSLFYSEAVQLLQITSQQPTCVKMYAL